MALPFDPSRKAGFGVDIYGRLSFVGLDTGRLGRDLSARSPGSGGCTIFFFAAATGFPVSCSGLSLDLPLLVLLFFGPPNWLV